MRKSRAKKIRSKKSSRGAVFVYLLIGAAIFMGIVFAGGLYTPRLSPTTGADNLMPEENTYSPEKNLHLDRVRLVTPTPTPTPTPVPYVPPPPITYIPPSDTPPPVTSTPTPPPATGTPAPTTPPTVAPETPYIPPPDIPPPVN